MIKRTNSMQIEQNPNPNPNIQPSPTIRQQNYNSRASISNSANSYSVVNGNSLPGANKGYFGGNRNNSNDDLLQQRVIDQNRINLTVEQDRNMARSQNPHRQPPPTPLTRPNAHPISTTTNPHLSPYPHPHSQPNPLTLTQPGHPIQATTIRHSRIPQAILRTIRQTANGKRPINDGMTTSKISRAILSNIREMKKVFMCEICACEYDVGDRKGIGGCEHGFCDGCLRQYVDYKIARFEEVLCPYEGCPQTLDPSSQFYNTLSQPLKDKYQKIHTFHQAAQQNQRLCPDEKCKQGILAIQQGINPKCNKCNKVYCKECFFPQHEGPCDQNQINFFQDNLKFRQCSNCKAVVEKKQGCNHITCRCKYQFCYLCGAKWLNYQHVCGRQDNQQVAAAAPQQPCCQCLQGQGCCTTILRLLVKIFLCFPIFLLFLTIHLIKLTLGFLLLLLITLILGIFPYTLQFICDMDTCCLSVVALVLYPLSMFVGIVRAFKDFFAEVFGDLLVGTCGDIQGGFETLVGW